MARDPTTQEIVPILKRDPVSVRYCAEIMTMEVSKYITVRKLKELAALHFNVNPFDHYLVNSIGGKMLYMLVDTEPFSQYLLFASFHLEQTTSETPILQTLSNSLFWEPSPMLVVDSSIPGIASSIFSCYLVSLLLCLIRSTNFKNEMRVAARKTHRRLSVTFRDMVNSKEIFDPQQFKQVVVENSTEFMKECPLNAHEIFTVFLSQVQAEINPNQTIHAACGTEAQLINEQSYFG
jgi:hypothetical protein